MNQDPADNQVAEPVVASPQTAPNTSAEPAAAPVRDNYAIAQSIYPDPTQIRAAAALARDMPATEIPTAASSPNYLTPLLGLGSSVSYIILAVLIRSFWGAYLLSLCLAIGAIYFASKSYQQNREMTPGMVIGLAAATTALVTTLNYIIALTGIHSLLFR